MLGAPNDLPSNIATAFQRRVKLLRFNRPTGFEFHIRCGKEAPKFQRRGCCTDTNGVAY
jgi:hypothetical protein